MIWLDRFEEEKAVLIDENDTVQIVEKNLCPQCKEGDILIWQHGKWVTDQLATQEQRKITEQLLQHLPTGSSKL